jgi:hypothetical protein
MAPWTSDTRAMVVGRRERWFAVLGLLVVVILGGAAIKQGSRVDIFIDTKSGDIRRQEYFAGVATSDMVEATPFADFARAEGWISEASSARNWRLHDRSYRFDGSRGRCWSGDILMSLRQLPKLWEMTKMPLQVRREQAGLILSCLREEIGFGVWDNDDGTAVVIKPDREPATGPSTRPINRQPDQGTGQAARNGH